MPGQKMHVDEIDIDVGLVRRLLAAQFPQWAALALAPVPSAGTVNALYRLGDDMLVRLPLRRGGSGGVEHEHVWLPRLAPLLPVATPVLLGKGTPAEGYPWPWSVYRWLEGENPTPGRIAAPDLLAKDLADFVAALHRIDPGEGPPAFRGGSLATRDAELRGWIPELRDLVDTDAAVEAWEAALEAPEWARPPVWVHSDLLPGNLLILQGRLSGVIDFAGSGVGDPACDLMVAWSLLPAGVRDDFRAALEVDDATWARGRGWALSQALIALPYYRDTNPVMAGNARHAIREVLAEHPTTDINRGRSPLPSG
jgi:aminoglycoside phosphotransferase (APT) family kinase protein